MMSIDPNGHAELVETIHQPWKASVRDCLRRWRTIPAPGRAQCYLVLHDGHSRRHTLGAGQIAELAAAFG